MAFIRPIEPDGLDHMVRRTAVVGGRRLSALSGNREFGLTSPIAVIAFGSRHQAETPIPAQT